MKKLILAQFIVLLIGTIFAWYNFFTELLNWLNERACKLGCSAGGQNPFLTPCFYGAIFFAVAFVMSVFILKESRKRLQ